jgi:hypothetical protein
MEISLVEVPYVSSLCVEYGFDSSLYMPFLASRGKCEELRAGCKINVSESDV